MTVISAMTATMIVANKIKEGLHEDSIITTNQLRRVDTILKQDYHSAINYYSEKELDQFGRLFDIIMNSAIAHIRNERVACTPQKVKNTISKKAIEVVQEYSGLEIGTKLKGINRQYLNSIVDYLYNNGFNVSNEKKENMLNELYSKRSKGYTIK